ncbi:MAG: 23S rRNA (uracil(1939)-C(5))-methyltransferase RlmD [bacterium]|nr:23S rRNA (uracil(1939)-C(5))-methyltransferase RlmD [bacterium]
MIKVGEKITLEIEKVIWEGKGLGHYNGQVVMVDYVLPGEKVRLLVREVKKDYIIGSLLDIVEPSKERIAPRCRHYYQCGGCSFQHTSYEYQLRLKKLASLEVISRILGREVNSEGPVKSYNPWYYRNKAQFPISREKGKVLGGFYKKGTHEIVDLEECPLHPPVFIDILQWAKDRVRKGYLDLRYLYIRQGTSGDIMVTFVVRDRLKNSKELAREITKTFPEVTSVYENINKSQSNVILGDKFFLIEGKEKLEQKLGNITFMVSPGAFFQVNAQLLISIIDYILEIVTPYKSGVFVDGYAGVGTFSLPLSRFSRYGYSIEENPAAVKDAIDNVRLNRISNIRIRKGKTEFEVRKILKNEVFDYLLVDPPRKGLDKEFSSFLSQIDIGLILYISCNPSTLARDIKVIESGNFVLKKLKGFDLFPQTAHIEHVAVLERR